VKIVLDYPPMIDEIDAAFHVRNQPVIYAWGDTIYNPKRITVTAPLMQHEMVHGKRQGDHVVEWWQEYIKSPVFRLHEELPAHVAEYQRMLKQHFSKVKAMDVVAKKLCAPLYGSLITLPHAKQLILNYGTDTN